MRDTSKILWKTSDGREIPVSEMTDSHLDNAYERVLNSLEKTEIEVFLNVIEGKSLKLEKYRQNLIYWKEVFEEEIRRRNIGFFKTVDGVFKNWNDRSEFK